MKLLTKEIERQLPALYDTEHKKAEDVKIIVKFFIPFSQARWYATEFDPTEGRFFGYVEIQPGGGELGYFMLSDLESVSKIPDQFPVARDIYFGKHYLSEVLAGDRP